MADNEQSALPLISIIVPCFNCETTIRKTIDSILGQTARNYQAILVDDGSTDATSRICDEYAAMNAQIVAVHQPNMGVTRARKKGVVAAKGEYIAFCDADDCLAPNYTEIIAKAVNTHPFDMLMFAMTVVKHDGQRVVVKNRLATGRYARVDIESQILPNLFSNGKKHSELVIKSLWSKCYAKELLLKVLPDLSDEIVIGEDWMAVFASLINARCVVCDNEHACYQYIENASSITGGDYIADLFFKFERLYKALFALAQKYGYRYKEQILTDALSCYLDAINKELRHGPGGYATIRRKVLGMIESEAFGECMKKCSLVKFGLGKRSYLRILVRKRIWLAYAIKRALNIFH